jgi:hypothetical protein
LEEATYYEIIFLPFSCNLKGGGLIYNWKKRVKTVVLP